MKLIILTSYYPYPGEPFIENEINMMWQLFSEILVIPLMYHGDKEIGETPENVRVLHLRRKRLEFSPAITAMLKMMSPFAWGERRFAYRELGYRKQKMTVNRLIFINCYISGLVEKTLKKIPIENDTIIYSYWLDQGLFFSHFKKKNPNIKCICRTHGGDCYINKFYRPFRRELLSFLDAVYPISEAGKRCLDEYILPHISGKHAEIAVQRLGTVKASDRMNPRAAANEPFEVVTCSNVIPIKRIDLMIEALSKICDRNIRWVHFGDGDIMEEIQHIASEKLSGLSNVEYKFIGRVPKDDILRWYEEHHVDVFVNCSDSEGIPVSIMEALSYGIPVIARNVGGNGEIVDSGKNGLLLPEECTPEMLSGAIMQIMEASEENAQTLREGAYRTFDEQYNAKKNYPIFYDRLAGSL